MTHPADPPGPGRRGDQRGLARSDGRALGLANPARDTASLYGTADAGVLGNETPLSITVRRFLARKPAAARELFGQARLPTLVQVDPFERLFADRDGTLVFSAESGVPLVRYQSADDGGVVPYAALIARLTALGFDAEAEAQRGGARRIRPLPYVYVFGRSQFAVSYYGANVFPDTVIIGLEQPAIRELVTGKFMLEVKDDADRNRELWIAVKLSARGAAAEPGPARTESATASPSEVEAFGGTQRSQSTACERECSSVV